MNEFPELYERYGRTKDKDLKEYLSKIVIVKYQFWDGHKTVYYPLTDFALFVARNKLRKAALTFEGGEINYAYPINTLKSYKTFSYLVKSSSRFFLKPDIGEVFDQLEESEILDEKLKAICINDTYYSLDVPEGDHFIMSAQLLTNKNENGL